MHPKSYQIRSNNANLGAITPFKVIQSHRIWYYQSIAHTGMRLPVTGIVINISLPPILHRFRDVAFDKSKITVFGYTSCV